ncbi:hypothetical protein HK100_009623 [Physocladia obscura]|uniref:7,8-diamino-pelargonic acid aminotransferase n=1 Tax=Physocladia obscura TaxID=109957 RepID=A0AAD5XKY3_9FUNG|nr:hypothetical protein HK100_009623 [Physocladia obscura]
MRLLVNQFFRQLDFQKTTKSTTVAIGTISTATKRTIPRLSAMHSKSGQHNQQLQALPEAELQSMLEFDRTHLWHPYTSLAKPLPTYAVRTASGAELELETGEKLGESLITNIKSKKKKKEVDGMSSWWCAVHGYGHPTLVDAATRQAQTLSHVMFGGITHAPAVDLGKALLRLMPTATTAAANITSNDNNNSSDNNTAAKNTAGHIIATTPNTLSSSSATDSSLECIFYADSGSVAVEAALKLAVQAQLKSSLASKHDRSDIMTVRGGYHGDTWNAMSVCDPVTGMHHVFGPSLPRRIFLPPPMTPFDAPELLAEDRNALDASFEQHSGTVAAFIIEPIVQGAGGMRFYSPHYLHHLHAHCQKHKILLIFDEIATGFGRTGKLFATNHTTITPDILILGKALTGGMMTLAAVICTRYVAVSLVGNSPFMHGPTFMANPLACAVARASCDLIATGAWEAQVARIAVLLEEGLAPARVFSGVQDVRVLGAIGVVELREPIKDMAKVQAQFVELGVWLRPFGKLVYLMPPYIVSDEQVRKLTSALCNVVEHL